jgi:hypothetical protein
MTAQTHLALVAVAACQVRPGDRVALCQDTPDFNEVAVAEYSPVGGVIAFCVGFKSEHHEGGVNFIPTIGWGRAFPGHYSWSKHFYATPEDAEVINARVDLFHEVYPDA